MVSRLLPITALMALWLAFAAQAPAQANPPAILDNGIVNAASFMRPPLAGSALAKGSLISIFGSNLGPQDGVSAAEFPLATTLAGVSIEIRTADGQSFAAIPLFVSAGQINAVVPSQTPAGPARVTVTRDGISSNSAAVKIVQSSFGLFGAAGYTQNAIAQKFVSPTDLPLATSAAPAKPGDTVTLWGTGLGPIHTPDNLAPEAGSLDTPIEVFVGHEKAEANYRGRAPCCSGVDQINIRIPANAPAGCFVPVWVTVRGSVHSNIATVPISADGAACSGNPDIPPPLNGAATGRIVMQRSVELDDSLLPVAGSTTDAAAAQFRQAERVSNGISELITPAPLEPANLPVLPPPGACLVYESTGPNAAGPSIDVGDAILMETSAGRVTIPRVENGYEIQAPPAALFLGAGAYQLQASSAANFPLFDARVTVGEPAHRQAIGNVEVEPRLTGATLGWTLSPGAPDSVLIAGSLPSTAGASAHQPAWICAARKDATSFTIPSALLANFPEITANVELISLWGPNRFETLTDGPESGAVSYLHREISNTTFGQVPLASTPVRLPDGTDIQAELAVSAGEEQRGLMFRRELPADQGMLFFFNAPGLYGFWMYNTLVPLDILWLDSARRVVFISANTPPCPQEVPTACPTYGGFVAAQYVLELAAGQAAAHGLTLGNTLAW